LIAFFIDPAKLLALHGFVGFVNIEKGAKVF
jgi:hypothetical protein